MYKKVEHVYFTECFPIIVFVCVDRKIWYTEDRELLSGFGHPTCWLLPDELPGTSQLKCFPWVSLLHRGHSWKQQRPFKDKPHDDDDDDDDIAYLRRSCYEKSRFREHY